MKFYYSLPDGAVLALDRPLSVGQMRGQEAIAHDGPRGLYGVMGVMGGKKVNVGTIDADFVDVVETAEVMFDTSTGQYADFQIETRIIYEKPHVRP